MTKKIKWSNFGSVDNAIAASAPNPEEIKVGDRLTKLSWTDRTPYEVVAVKDQKHITIRELGHRTPEGRNNAFTDSQYYEYYSDRSNPCRDICRRGNYWYWETTITSDILDKMEELDEADQVEIQIFLGHHNVSVDDLKAKGKITRYSRENFVFGYAEYYYDWSF